jgi:hypothetical protein
VPDKLRYIVQDADRPPQFDIWSNIAREIFLGTQQDQSSSPNFNKSDFLRWFTQGLGIFSLTSGLVQDGRLMESVHVQWLSPQKLLDYLLYKSPYWSVQNYDNQLMRGCASPFRNLLSLCLKTIVPTLQV